MIPINLFIFLSGTFLLTFLIGRGLEKIKIPWIFSALLIGAVLTWQNPFSAITSSETFSFISQLGMYFLLFIIGFEIDLKEMKKKAKLIMQSTLLMIVSGTILGGLAIHFLFGTSWLISALVALSFATVGEAILIPILDEFKIINTKLGQAIIGVGTFDDIFEVLVLVIIGVVIGTHPSSGINLSGNFLVLVSLFVLLLLTIFLIKLKNEGEKFHFSSVPSTFLFSLFILFLFLGVGLYAESAALAALLSGISLRTFMPKKRIKMIENEVKTMCYGFFAPIFFLSVGLTLDIKYIIAAPLTILILIIVATIGKLFSGYITGKKELGTKGSILFGIGLSVRFSTSIIIIKILFDKGLIKSPLFSAIVASSIVFTFVIPILFSKLLLKWKFAKDKNVTKRSNKKRS